MPKLTKKQEWPVRFCHVIDSCTPNPLLFNSIKFSDREKFDYQVIALGPEAGLQAQMSEIGVPVRSLNYTSRKQALSVFIKLFSIFRRERIGVVQTHLMDASLIGLSAARVARVALSIFTGHHSHEIPLYKRKWLTFMDGSNGRFFAKHTIAPTASMKEIFVRDLKIAEKKVSVLHHGFDLKDWRDKASQTSDFRKEFGFEDKIVFGAVGRLFWVKNFENLIRGFATVVKNEPNIILAIVGAGDRSKLEQLVASLGLHDKVFFTGPRSDMAAVMKSFDILVHPSLAESFGMIYIEALALGKPVLSTKVGIATDVIENGKNGYLVNGSDASSIAQGLAKMLDAKENWEEWGQRGIIRAEDFDIRKTQPICDAMYAKWLIENQ